MRIHAVISVNSMPIQFTFDNRLEGEAIFRPSDGLIISSCEIKIVNVFFLDYSCCLSHVFFMYFLW
jgi:hypothetical protein